MGFFDLIGDIVSLPLDVVSDVSKAIQGEEVESVADRLEEIGDDIEDIFSL